MYGRVGGDVVRKTTEKDGSLCGRFYKGSQVNTQSNMMDRETAVYTHKEEETARKNDEENRQT